jgi:colanic acid biosynthesis glycosyl transferase WcaI
LEGGAGIDPNPANGGGTRDSVKLLFINQHYPPDSGATGRLTAQLAEQLVRNGHEVTVLTGRPTYDEAKALSAPRDEVRAGVRVIRLPLLARRNGPLGRALHYLSFAVSLVIGGLRISRPDVIHAYSSTPMFGGVAALLLARLKRCPLVYGVNDVYPEMAVALGVLREGALARLGRFLETWAWRSSTRLVLIGERLREVALNRGIDEGRLVVIPNWADANRIEPLEDRALRREWGIGDEEFLVEYAGNFGRSQDLQNVLEAARIVERESANVRFVFVGSGSASEVDEWTAAVPSLKVLPFQPEERLSEVLSAADLSLVPLRRGLGRYCVPSKVYSILASGRPVGAVLDHDNDVARIVEQIDCGFRVEPDDPESLAREILRLAGDPDLARRQGRNGREFGECEGSLERAANDYECVFWQASGVSSPGV